MSVTIEVTLEAASRLVLSVKGEGRSRVRFESVDIAVDPSLVRCSTSTARLPRLRPVDSRHEVTVAVRFRVERLEVRVASDQRALNGTTFEGRSTTSLESAGADRMDVD